MINIKENENINKIISLVYDELLKAKNKHNNFNSMHEGYSVILEELDELWDEVKKKKEAIQVAAMAIRFITDCC